ncbi:lymphoid-specific helicase isoform X2 [Denticeps clupeoides]|nr:lymphoid-specific helicase isoform X2 [Denticeps clupeoides]
MSQSKGGARRRRRPAVARCMKEEGRSVSPQCPKPNESEEPEGTMLQESQAEVMDNVITKEMEEEEKHLQEEGERKEQEMMEQARQSFPQDSMDMRFKRLQHLLKKSNIYSKFLLTKMEQQQKEEKAKKERMEKKAPKENVGDKKGDKVERKKRGREDDYKIADVMSKEEIMSKAKKGKFEEEAGPSSKKLEAEDIEKLSDTNEDIKSRLSEAVRENAKHMVDPHRKINGQPVPAQQPHLFTGGVMRWYQVEGTEWLRMLWENGINGILADEMGLGKTVQVIGHIAMMLEKKVLGPYLVVGPLSTLPNWISEFKRFTPDVSVVLYHGNIMERHNLIKKLRKPRGPLQMCPVVVTSFEIAMRDRKKLQMFHWRFLIVDEGHRIKNMNCRLVRELKSLQTDNKLLLTGTPLQNNLAELWSLLNFLLPDVFDDLKSFESWFDINSFSSDAENIITSKREQEILHMLHQILTPFLLRRLKSDVTLEVPPKKEIVIYAPLTPLQEALYKAIADRSIANMLGQDKKDSVDTVALSSTGRPRRRTRRTVDYSEVSAGTASDLEKCIDKLQKEMDLSPSEMENVLLPQDSQINLKLQNILMMLKRCCNHAYLIQYPLNPATGEFRIDEELVKASGKFLVLDRMLPELKKRGHKVLIFSQMTSLLDILMDYCYLRDYKYSRLDGKMKIAERDENIRKFSEDPEIFLFLLSTRAGGLGINLTAADTVIIYDSDWNPQADLQAQDRCHRIGQTKPVLVYRLITANTIDQNILERASAKRKLEKMVIHKKKFKGGAAELKQDKNALDASELLELLKSRDYERAVKNTKGKVISDKDLEFLLDRSDLMDKAKKKRRKQQQEKDGVFRVIETEQGSEISLS